jgi:photosystem II stability/assembly factor-like uncharacterized protein
MTTSVPCVLAIAALAGCARTGSRPAGARAVAVTAPPTAEDLHAGHFAGERLALFATHASGDLFVSGDGGATWQRGAGLADQFLEAVWLFDSGVGFVAGERGLYRTSDGGRTLSAVPESAGLNLYGLQFPSPERGFAVGFEAGRDPAPALLRSDDGGRTWRRMAGPGRTLSAALQFTSPDSGIVAADRDLWQSRDGGVRWTLVARDLGRVRAIHRAPGGRWWAVGHDGLVATSEDGATWAVAAGRPSQLLRDVLFAGERDGWLAGDAAPPSASSAAAAPPVWRTRDGGRTWSPVEHVRFDVHRLLRAPNGAVVAIGDGGAVIELRP